MVKNVKESGVALIYALLVSVSFIVFFAALVIQQRGTLGAVRQSEDLVKARALAGLANDLVFQMVKDGSVDWSGGLPWKFSNRPESPDYFRDLQAGSQLEGQLSAQALGGYFDVVIDSANNIGGVDTPQSGGTYLLSVAKAQVGQRVTQMNESSRLLFKLGVPFVNNLSVIQGNMTLHSESNLDGPVFVQEIDSGAGGNVNFLAHTTEYSFLLGQNTQKPQTIDVSGAVRARGEIRIVNRDPAGVNIVAKVLPEGRVDPGEQVTVPALFAPTVGVGIGGIQPSEELLIEPKVPLAMEISKIDEIFADLDEHAGVVEIDLDSLGPEVAADGVLVEFVDSELRIHQVEQQFLGRQFDLGVLHNCFKPDDNQIGITYSFYNIYAGGDWNAMALLALKEYFWDDPAFPNEPTPTNLREAFLGLDQNSDGTPEFQEALGNNGLPAELLTESDCIDYYGFEAGTLIDTVDLSRDTWRILRFRSSTRSSNTNGHEKVAPPVYVRGRVEGKIFLAYEMTGPENTWENGRLPNKIAVLADPGMNGTPAGITLKDPNVQLDPNSTGDYSEDMVVLACNGVVHTSGLPVHNMRWLCGQPGGTPAQISSGSVPKDWEFHRDYFQERAPLGSPQRQWMKQSAPMVPAPLHAITVSRRNSYRNSNHSVNGRQRSESDSILSRDLRYTQLSSTWDEIHAEVGVSDTFLQTRNEVAVLPYGMRLAFTPFASSALTFGAQAFLFDGTATFEPGEHVYDYRWRSLDAETLHKDMGLTVTPILIDRRGL